MDCIGLETNFETNHRITNMFECWIVTKIFNCLYSSNYTIMSNSSSLNDIDMLQSGCDGNIVLQCTMHYYTQCVGKSVAFMRVGLKIPSHTNFTPICIEVPTI